MLTEREAAVLISEKIEQLYVLKNADPEAFQAALEGLGEGALNLASGVLDAVGGFLGSVFD